MIGNEILDQPVDEMYRDEIKKRLISRVKGYVDVNVIEDHIHVEIVTKSHDVRYKFKWTDPQDFYKLVRECKPISYSVDRILDKYDRYTRSITRAIFYKSARD